MEIDTAREQVARLFAPLPDDATPPAADVVDALPQLELLRYAIHAPYFLPDAVRARVGGSMRDALRPIAGALGVDVLDLVGCLRRGDPTLRIARPPWRLAGHDHLGALDVRGKLVIADPCHLTRRGHLSSLRVDVRPGAWHAFVKCDRELPVKSIGLAVIHEAHRDSARSRGEKLGVFVVDSGRGAIADARIDKEPALRARLTGDLPIAEALLGDVVCVAGTRWGDGAYDAYGVRAGGALVAVWLDLYGEQADPEQCESPFDPDYDAVWAAPAKPAIAYSARIRLAPGDRIRHPIFGEGQVIRDVDRGKVEVGFGDGPRVLVHDRR